MRDGHRAGWTRDQSRLMEVPSCEANKQLVIAGMGISFLSACAIWLEIQAGLLVVLDVDGFPVQRSLCVAHLSGKPLSAVGQAFKQFLVTEGAARINLLASAAGQPREPEESRNTAAADFEQRARCSWWMFCITITK
jgi:LysR family transcriptional regulator, low CO2-responsive transcriptional regulator